MIIIEQATAEDLPAIAELAELALWDHFPSISSNEQIQYMISRGYTSEIMLLEMQNGQASYIKLLDANELAGFASYGPVDTENAMQLHKLYIHPGFQRMGYASALVGYVQDKAIQGGYKNLVLSVYKNNKKAISAYEMNGFVIRESVNIDIGNGFYKDDYIMIKYLSSVL